MDEPENFTPLQKEQSPNGHKPPMRMSISSSDKAGVGLSGGEIARTNTPSVELPRRPWDAYGMWVSTPFQPHHHYIETHTP